MTGRLPKVPRKPLGTLNYLADDILAVRPALWRLHRIKGTYASPWNGFRAYGPVRSARYDPHPEPADVYPGFGVNYAAADVATSAAEVFQASRRISTNADIHLTSWTPTRDLRLLDLTGDWALRNGAPYALTAAPRPTCRAWSRAIRLTWGWIDGIWAPSTLTGRPIAALFESAVDSFPADPAFTRPSNNLVVWNLLADAAGSISFDMS